MSVPAAALFVLLVALGGGPRLAEPLAELLVEEVHGEVVRLVGQQARRQVVEHPVEPL